MNAFEIKTPAQDISDIFWRNLITAHSACIRFRLPHLDNDRLVAEHLRTMAAYNTGSIPSATATALMILAAELKPDRTFELGTFIGNSTRALALYSARVWTCDGHNDIGLGLPNVTQYRKTMSTDALKAYGEAKPGPIELFFVDGRLLAEDMPLVTELTDDETVFALDDCYQLEKGVMNVHALGLAVKPRPLFYVPPPRGEPFAAVGIPGGITLGLAVHTKRMVMIKA